MLTYSEGFGFLEAVALQILMFSWRLVSYDGEIHCVIVMKRALRTVAQIDLYPDDVTQLFAWRGSIGIDYYCRTRQTDKTPHSVLEKMKEAENFSYSMNFGHFSIQVGISPSEVISAQKMK